MNLEKSQVPEWLIENPSNWQVVPLKSAFRRVKRKTEKQDGIITAFRDGEVTLRSNRRTQGFTEADDLSGYQEIVVGDLVIHSMDAFAGCIGVSDSNGIGSPVLSVCQAVSDNDPRFMSYQLRAMAGSGWIESLSRSIRERTSEFRWNEAGSQKVLLPDLQTQIRVANYLDFELGNIDNLIEKQTLLVELLRERRNGLIINATTKGIDSTIQTKDSPAPWIRKIPSNWEAKPLYTVGRKVNVINRDGLEARLLSLSHGNIIEKSIESNEGLLPESFDTYQIVLPNDIVFRFTDLQNDQKSLRSAIVREKGMITSAYLALRPFGVLPEFLNYQFRAIDLLKVFYGMGSGLRQSLRFTDARKLFILLPSDKEQIEIVEFLDRKTKDIDNLIDGARRAIKLLRERKQSIVARVAVGDIRVEA